MTSIIVWLMIAVSNDGTATVRVHTDREGCVADMRDNRINVDGGLYSRCEAHSVKVGK